MSKAETIRRLLIGELQRVYRGRYGPTLPDDDAGRDDLELMLIHAAPDKRSNMLAVWAPWMSDADAEATLAGLPAWRPNVEAIGERIRLTNAEREACGVRLIFPVDITKAELAERKKAKKRARQERAQTQGRRRAACRVSRDVEREAKALGTGGNEPANMVPEIWHRSVPHKY